MKHLLLSSLLLAALGTQAQIAAVPAPEAQIKLAVLSAPADKRDGATVLGYNAQGEVVTLRKGTNEFICLADDPAQKGFSVSCYHQSLEPFMARGRELKKAGKTAKEIMETREAEVKSGKLKMNAQPANLIVFSGKDENVDLTIGTVRDGNHRYVVYIPYATAETTGLPLKPDVPGQPWIMDPGTHRAHIMITPPAPK
jgi:opacity protein-like surface antigen